MTVSINKSTFLAGSGYAWRNLWMARNLNGVSWINSVPNGPPLTMTNYGANPSKRTTCEGIHFTGAATSHMTFTDPYDGAAGNDLWISLRFKLNQDHETGDDLKILLGKWDDIDNRILIYLNSADGKLYVFTEEGGNEEFINSAETTWNAGQWYHVIGSFSSVGGSNNGQRLIVDDGTPVTDAGNNQNMTLTADIYIGNDRVAGVDGFKGAITDVVMGNDTLSSTEESDLFNGIPPADSVNLFKLNEGGEDTVYDDGSGADDGTLGALATWAWGATKEPVASFSGIDQYAISPADMINVSGDQTWVWLGKIKSNYGSGVSSDHYLFETYEDADNQIEFRLNSTANDMRWQVEGNGDFTYVDMATRPYPWIDQYAIFVLVMDFTNSELQIYYNGKHDTDLTPSTFGNPLSYSTLYVGAEDTPSYYDVSEVMLIGQIKGALTPLHARTLSRVLNYKFNTGILI